MKIGILEMHYHAELVNTMINIFDNPHIYTTKEIYDDLPLETKLKGTYNFYQRKEQARTFINNINTHDFDYFFINTIQPSMVDLYKWKHFNPKCPTILTLHNLNAWYNPNFIPRKNILHSTDSYISKRYASTILKKFTTINVGNPSILQYAQKCFPNKKIICIPFSYALPNQTPTHNAHPQFVVPGTVDNRRRDYQTVIDAFEPLHEDYPNITLTFLGKSQDKFPQEFITSYKTYIPRTQYNQTLKDADFIICPIRRETHTVNTATEYYGTTKSPNIFDAIKYRKPLIIPDDIPVPKELLSTTLEYSGSETLFNICSEYLEHRHKIEQLQMDAIDATKNFELKNIKGDVKKWMNQK